MERPREFDHLELGSVPLLRDSLRDAARYMLRVRKAAKAHFGRASQSEAAWNLLLTLQAMEDGQQGCHIGMAAKGADVPHTTALRSLRSLQPRWFRELAPGPCRQTSNAGQNDRERGGGPQARLFGRGYRA